MQAAQRARERGCAQVLWLDGNRHRALQEVGMMNLFVRIGDEVITPVLDGAFLAGVTRDAALRLLRRWDLRVSEREITIDEVIAASDRGDLREVFGTGTAAVVAPVGELATGERTLKIGDGRPGPIAARLYETLTGIQQGLREDVDGWMEPVPALS
jgi:branched-chain amino acid aminotransferase